ncbi:MAG: peptide chain release factor N(5)-glutamine methyltransferase [bacterium]
MSPVSVKDLYRSLVLQLSEMGVMSPVGDARLIIEHIADIGTMTDILTVDISIDDEKLDMVDGILEERKSGRPVQYIIGWTNFYGRRFEITDGVFIPRFETEVLVRRAIEILGDGEGKSVVDICCGAGAIAITVAFETKADCFAVDIDRTAVEIARANKWLHGMERRVSIWQGDLLTGIKDNVLFNLALANPPYIKAVDMENMPTEVRYERMHALYGGENGFDVIKRITSESRKHLIEGGSLLIEFGGDMPDGFEKFLSDCGLKLRDILKDLSGRDRVIELDVI